MSSIYRRTLISLVMMSLAGAATAATAPAPATGMGQSWPAASDVSPSAHFHTYVFQHSGIRYVQVNDASGAVRGAIGLVGDQILVLPMGRDAVRWTIVDPSTPMSGETVYRDDATTVQAAPQPDGTMRLMVVSDCKAHPEECSVKGP